MNYELIIGDLIALALDAKKNYPSDFTNVVAVQAFLDGLVSDVTKIVFDAMAKQAASDPSVKMAISPQTWQTILAIVLKILEAIAL